MERCKKMKGPLTILVGFVHDFAAGCGAGVGFTVVLFLVFGAGTWWQGAMAFSGDSS